jgi:hypothetical protein
MPLCKFLHSLLDVPVQIAEKSDYRNYYNIKNNVLLSKGTTSRRCNLKELQKCKFSHYLVLVVVLVAALISSTLEFVLFEIVGKDEVVSVVDLALETYADGSWH